VNLAELLAEDLVVWMNAVPDGVPRRVLLWLDPESTFIRMFGAGEPGSRRTTRSPAATGAAGGTAHQYDFTVQAVNQNPAKEGAETALAFFISMVSALLDRRPDPTTVVVGEMTVRGLLQKVSSLPERLQLALEAGAKRILIPSENKRDIADVPDEVLNKLQPVFYTDPMHAAIRAMGLE